MSSLRIQLPVLTPPPPGEVPSLRGGGGKPPTAHALTASPTPARPAEGPPGRIGDPPRREPNLILDGERGYELSYPSSPKGGGARVCEGGGGESPAPHGSTSDPSSPDRSSPLAAPSPAVPSHTSPFHFSPSQAATSQLLEALSDPTLSLITIARTFDTTLDALVAWMERPDIQQQLHTIHSVIIRRNQLVAAGRMTKVILACEDILDGYIDEELNNPIQRTDTRSIEQRRRSRETARKAATLLARIARWSSPPPKGEVPSLRGGGGRTPKSQQTENPQRPNVLPPSHPDPLDTYILNAGRRISEELATDNRTTRPAPALPPRRPDDLPATRHGGPPSASLSAPSASLRDTLPAPASTERGGHAAPRSTPTCPPPSGGGSDNAPPLDPHPPPDVLPP